jgi:hypothetical protein
MRTGDRRSKLDCHNFTGTFLGYTASNHIIRYLNLDSGVVKESHHAVFDEAWYIQPYQPLAAQLLYELGLEADKEMLLESGPEPCLAQVPYPPMPINYVDKNNGLSQHDVSIPCYLYADCIVSGVGSSSGPNCSSSIGLIG